jgi:hypothetical protein
MTFTQGFENTHARLDGFGTAKTEVGADNLTFAYGQYAGARDTAIKVAQNATDMHFGSPIITGGMKLDTLQKQIFKNGSSDNGIDIPNSTGWIYPDVPDGGKIAQLVDGYKNLDYRQKSLLDNAIRDTLNGNLSKLSAEIRHDPSVWKAYADVMSKTTGASVKLGEDPLYHSPQMTLTMPASTQSIVFAWQGGLDCVYGTDNGKKISLDSDARALNSMFSNVVRKFRSDYMQPSMLR